ncbi:related to Separin [Moesziomyces antarcticus]|nr:related to Separin [Moesziomyces antarcticus]
MPAAVSSSSALPAGKVDVATKVAPKTRSAASRTTATATASSSSRSAATTSATSSRTTSGTVKARTASATKVAAPAPATTPSTRSTRTTPASSSQRSSSVVTSSSSSRAASSTSRATSVSKPSAAATATATKPAPTSKTVRSTAAATVRSRTAASPAQTAQQTVLQQSWTEAQVLEALKLPKEVPVALPHYLLLRLGTSAQELLLEQELTSSPSFDPVPEKLATARSIYFAKQLVNAGLSWLSQLANSGWSANSAETASELPHVLAAAHTFRIATRFLLLPRDVAGTGTAAAQKELEVETIILRTTTKLKSIGLSKVAHADCLYLARISAHFPDAEAIVAAAPTTLLLPHFTQTTDSASEPSPARMSFLLDLQSHSVIKALEAADLDSLDSIHTDLNHEHGPLAWQLYARRSGGETKVLDRVAFAAERAISKALQRLEAPNSQEYLPLRTLALQLLVQVSDIDLAAFWERVARTGGAVLKTAHKDGLDLASTYDAVHDAFETVIATAANLAEHAGAEHNKMAGDGFQRFCEHWLNFARKAGSTTGVERATAVMAGAPSSALSSTVKTPATSNEVMMAEAEAPATSSPLQERQWSDQDLAKICAKLTACVLALDNVLAGKSDADTQSRLDDACKVLQRELGGWPTTAATSSQIKLHRVVDQIHRRCCTKLASQGCDSKGQPKQDTASAFPVNVDSLARACLQLLRELFACCQPSTSASAMPSSESVKSTPARPTSLPTRDACLLDLVHGHRVLANKLFSISSSRARAESLGVLESCHALLQSELARSLPASVLSEQLRLLCTSFYNPGGMLYNAVDYVEAANFLQGAVDCDIDSIDLLRSSYDGEEQPEVQASLQKRQDSLNKKLEYTAVSYRLGGDKERALQMYRKLVLSIPSTLQTKIGKRVSDAGIEQCFKSAEGKSLAGWIKAITDMSVHELGSEFDLDDQKHSLAHWVLHSDQLETSVKGAILEQAIQHLDARSHLASSVKAIGNIHQCLLRIYDATHFPLRRARTIARMLEMDVLSHALALTEDEVAQMEEDAIKCVDSPSLGKDEGLGRFKAQYRCSLLLSTALHIRLRRPYESPEIVAEKVEAACMSLSSATRGTPKKQSAQSSPRQPSSSSPRSAQATPNATPSTRASARGPSTASVRLANNRRALGQRSAPPQKTAALPSGPTTPPSRGKPVFESKSTAVSRSSPQAKSQAKESSLDNARQFCQSALTISEAFAALALTQCSVHILKVVRQAIRHSDECTPDADEMLCRAGVDLAQAYLRLGKTQRAEGVLRSAMTLLSGQTSTGSPSTQLVVLTDHVRFRCLMTQAELSCQTRDLAGAQARLIEGLALAKGQQKGDKAVSSSMERLLQRERQALAFAVAARLHVEKGDLASSIESITQALRQLIRLSSNLASIASRTSAQSDGQVVQAGQISKDASEASSDVVMDTPDSQEQPQPQPQEEQLPKFCGAVFSSLFWRSCRLLLESYMRLSTSHSIRGSAVEAESLAGEAVDFATSMRFALPLARALVQRGELRLQLNRTELGQQDLSRCMEVLQETWIPEVVPLSYVQGDCLMRIEQLGEALRSYATGEATLRTLSSAFVEAEHASPSPKAQSHHRRKSSLSNSAWQHRMRLSHSATGAGMDVVLPDVQSRLLQRQAWILHLMGEAEQSEDAVEKAAGVWDGLASIDVRVDQFVLEGRIALRRALQHLKGDHFFSMLPEAAISIPMVPSVSVRTLAATAGSNHAISEETVKAAFDMLTPADSAFREALSLGLRSSHSLSLREAFASLAQVYTTQAALGKNVKMAANAAAALLDWASSVGVRRSLLMSIAAKLRNSDAGLQDQDWPVITDDHAVARSARSSSAGMDDCDQDVLPSRLAKLTLNDRPRAGRGERSSRGNPWSAFWQSVRLRHQEAQHDAGSAKLLLPRNWTVVSISVRSTDVENLVLTRQQGGGGADGCSAKEAVLYSLPMNRRSKRDGTEEDEEHLTLAAAKDKLVEIVQLSNDGIHGVRDIQGMEGRRQWWTERHRLDDELRDLLQELQDTWLGGFKGVFAEPMLDDRAVAGLRARFEKIIRRACFPTANKRPTKLKMDDAVFECFAGLPADCTDEDLEDLVHYVMDALQFSGFQVAVDEIDLDETAMDLRGALEEFHGKKVQASPNKVNMAYVAAEEEEEASDHHIFLVLDKDTAPFPWESMPILRGKSVSRIPSMAFLQDRIQMAPVFCRRPAAQRDDTDDEDEDVEASPLQKGRHGARTQSRSPSKTSRTPRAATLGSKSNERVDDGNSSLQSSAWQVALRNGKLYSLSKRRTSYLLNPGGDLVQSQERFEGWLKGRASLGWKGIVGRQPIVDELPEALSTSDLLLYFGHGGAEPFIRQSKLRDLERCAVAMLWGCSSAMLHDNGDFDRTGTPLNYMCGGAPAMVGNLWDMTDRELDSVCEGVFGRLGLMEAGERAPLKSTARKLKVDANGILVASRAPTQMSLARAIAESRDDCRLPYLTGASTVVYGVPVYWNDDAL